MVACAAPVATSLGQSSLEVCGRRCSGSQARHTPTSDGGQAMTWIA
jgi:hypothetical protein